MDQDLNSINHNRESRYGEDLCPSAASWRQNLPLDSTFLRTSRNTSLAPLSGSIYNEARYNSARNPEQNDLGWRSLQQGLPDGSHHAIHSDTSNSLYYTGGTWSSAGPSEYHGVNISENQFPDNGFAGLSSPFNGSLVAIPISEPQAAAFVRSDTIRDSHPASSGLFLNGDTALPLHRPRANEAGRDDKYHFFGSMIPVSQPYHSSQALQALDFSLDNGLGDASLGPGYFGTSCIAEAPLSYECDRMRSLVSASSRASRTPSPLAASSEMRSDSGST
ncbi:hypothetical protein CTAM01_12718 [Colletotrichum tamarilloi]|uniref:Uncharacterized protein n=1 Tax=Colletotrichum tamarilloi TaxID=1209934 RepID=A0ABQ9QTY4_9PEZI|nr:uncharacterized protein CTAM01_12718 [Colletotrichum tamarilloi]KAK1485092.1 hypothetical protein CTAM01_12718 [Colletotrichum tamarilloi]